jgi:hypothetical protein
VKLQTGMQHNCDTSQILNPKACHRNEILNKAREVHNKLHYILPVLLLLLLAAVSFGVVTSRKKLDSAHVEDSFDSFDFSAVDTAASYNQCV